MNKMLKLTAAALLATSVSLSAFADNYNIGISGGYGKFKADGTQTKDGITKSENGSANFPFASIFVEYSQKTSGQWNVVYGLDYIPLKTEIDKRSESETDKRTGCTTGCTGDKEATLDLKNHATLYIQPTYDLGGGTAVFGKLGYSHADLKISSTNAATGSTLNSKDNLQGALIGLGVQNAINKDTFARLEVNYTDYKKVSYTNSTGTQFTANPELWTAKISIVKSF
jgi:opacity protein-like surface antigen